MARPPLSADTGTQVACVARLGLMAWFFGNLYEGAVGMPQLLAYARHERPPGLLTSGSPVRYYALVAPVALGANAVTLVHDWRSGRGRPLVAATMGCLLGAVALTGYLIRTVNLPLLRTDEPLTELERRQLAAHWHEVNAARLVLLAAAHVLEQP
jgi:hypothetical protein